ncbi:MAG: hypothetical protein IPL84_11395 [Chitinophagaceae bacterium]|nr:hypothetical protein [Chitinophagaceae bacterium]
MIKNFFLVVFLLSGSSVYAQFTIEVNWKQVAPGSAGDSIYYDPYKKLVWSDFRGKPDQSNPAAAITESGFGYKMSMQSLNKRTNVQVVVFCYFNKKKSWVKKGMANNYALTHEQHHFDVTYINAALFVEKLQKAKFNSKNFNELVNDIYDECFNALSKMQNDYDGQTSNGRIREMQLFWNKKIDQQLETLPID